MNLHEIYRDITNRRISLNVDTTEKQLLFDIADTLLRIEKALAPSDSEVQSSPDTNPNPIMTNDSSNSVIASSRVESTMPTSPIPTTEEPTIVQDVNPPTDNRIPTEIPAPTPDNPSPMPTAYQDTPPVEEPVQAPAEIPTPTPAETPVETPIVPQEAPQPDVTVPTPEQVIQPVDNTVNTPVDESAIPSTLQVDNTATDTTTQTTPQVDTTTPQVDNTVVSPGAEQVVPPVEEQVTPQVDQTAIPTPTDAQNTPVGDTSVEFAQEIAPKKARKSSKK